MEQAQYKAALEATQNQALKLGRHHPADPRLRVPAIKTRALFQSCSL